MRRWCDSELLDGCLGYLGAYRRQELSCDYFTSLESPRLTLSLLTNYSPARKPRTERLRRLRKL